MRRSVLVLLLLVLATATGARAQFPAEVRGRVTDRATGAAVPGARVEVTGGGIETAAAPDGRFLLRGLLPGVREIRVAAPGFGERRLTVQAENGRSLWLPVELEPAPVALEGLRVVATRTEAGATVLDRARIQASGARELGELLRDQGGVTVTRRGGPGSPATVSIRGSGAGEVLVLVDGVPINSLMSGEADLSTVPLEAIERVTVLRGAQSARYGGRALAGVIAVETRRPASGELGARVESGSWGERAAALSAGGRRDVGGAALSGLASGEWRTVRGDFPFAVPVFRGGGSAPRLNADARLWSALATGALEGVRGEVRARLEGVDVERGMPGSIVQPSLDARQEQRRGSAGLSARSTMAGTDWRATLDAQRQTAAFHDPAPALGAPYDESVAVNGFGGSLSAGRRTGDFGLTAGVEARELRFTSTMLAEGSPDRQGVRAAWVQGEWSRSLTGAWTLEVASTLRADRSSLLDGTQLSPRLGVSLGSPRLAAHLSAGSAFAPPSLADQFFQEGVQARPNPALRPERVRMEVEGGVEARDLPLGPVRLGAEASAYRADVRGMILWFPDFRFVWQPDNFDVHRAGWEGSALARFPLAHAEVRGGVAFADVEYAGPVLSGQVAYRPRWTGNASAATEVLGVRGEVAARYVGERRVAPGSALNTLDPYWLADARLSRSLLMGAWRGEVGLTVENLLDRDAAMLVDYPYPGRSWSVSLRVRRESHRTEASGDLSTNHPEP
ncbi:MAG: TonB-dependent receptor [Gemmatimonadetes bacterium]|nr:TonB-dependent receptor [Gemmatimonadota bacterium]